MNAFELKFAPDSTIDEAKIIIGGDFKKEARKLVASLSNDTSRQRGFLNLITKTIFLEWLRAVSDLNCQKYSPKELDLDLTIWEFVNGSSVSFGNQKIVLIPGENEDKTSVTIPQEWLMIPQWVGSYYVAADVNLEEDYIEFWGYTTYEEIQSHGEVDRINHYVHLDFGHWKTDINLMVLEAEYGLENIPNVSFVAPLSLAEKERLLSQAEKSLFPRLSLNFFEWLTLVADENFRRRLLASRKTVNLRDWLEKHWDLTLARGWQNLEEFIRKYLQPCPRMAISFRYFNPEEAVGNLLKEDLNNIGYDLLSNLYNYLLNNPLDYEKPGEENRKTQLVSKLAELVDKTDNEDKCWQAALCLNLLDSSHPLSPLGLGKIIPFESLDFSCAILVYIMAKNQDKVNTFIRILPMETDSLPPGFAMEIIEENGSIFRRVEAGPYDRIIQYKFWGNPGEYFGVRLQIGEEIKEEKFVI